MQQSIKSAHIHVRDLMCSTNSNRSTTANKCCLFVRLVSFSCEPHTRGVRELDVHLYFVSLPFRMEKKVDHLFICVERRHRREIESNAEKSIMNCRVMMPPPPAVARCHCCHGMVSCHSYFSQYLCFVAQRRIYTFSAFAHLLRENEIMCNFCTVQILSHVCHYVSFRGK